MSVEDRAAQLELVLDHYHNPRNHGEMPGADVHLQGGHSGCSDIVTMYLKFNGDRIQSVSFTGEGCTISQAAASMVTEMVQGLTAEQVEELDYHALIDYLGEELVKTRPRCATLGMDTVKAAIKEYRAKKIREAA
jgi:nitrogen fixation NifU-like protein